MHDKIGNLYVEKEIVRVSFQLFCKAKDLFVRSFCLFVKIRVSLLHSLISFTDAHSRTLFHLPNNNSNTVKCSDFFVDFVFVSFDTRDD